MARRFLMTRPRHDSATSYLSQWGGEILDEAKEASVQFTDFQGEKASRENVSKYLSKQKPGLVVFNGHGGPTEICGHADEPIIRGGDNERLLAGAVTYAVACSAAADLGAKIVEKGGKAFIGYSGPFSFVSDANRECTPSRDKFAEPFKRVSNEVVASLLQGKTAGDAYKRSQDFCSRVLREYSTSDAFLEYREMRFWLFWDKYYQKLLGDENAVF